GAEVQPLPSPPPPERGGLYREGLSTAVRLLFSLDERVLDAARVSLLCSLAALLLAMLAGVPLALGCGRNPGRAGRVFLVLARTGMAVPTVVIGLLLYGIFSRAGMLGGLAVLYSPAAIIIGEFFLALPIVIALGAEAFAALDWRTERTARTLGAGPMRVRWTLLREAGPGVLAAHLAAFGRVVSELGIAVMLGANIAGHTRTMTTTIAMETQKGMFGHGLAVGFLLLLIALALNLLAALWRSRVV
ncbi:MAG: ABC transporter permease, partial [Planctomycetota bacterium]